ncbi:arylsulfatase [Fusarium sp. NRRL 52700]|nr:arylsulfatase [Fusarium sp. NRRL 52700]
MKFSLALQATAFFMAATSVAATGKGATGKKHSRRPNFVLIMSDDQDKHLNSLEYQPALQKHIASLGTTFEKHYCTMAQCCPSRVSFLTGRHGHNTNVTDVNPPYGGYPKFVERGFNENYLPVWLQQAGYNTYYVGKLMNSHTDQNYNKPYPAGFNGTDFLIQPNIYMYKNASFQRNHEKPKYYPGQYNTDLVTQKSLGYLDDAADHVDERPFFMFVMPIGPHSEVSVINNVPQFGAPVPADRHAHLYPKVKVPRSSSFNPSTAKDISFLKTLPKANSTVVDYWDEYYRLRLRALASVDDMIDDVMAKLEQRGLLDNTYVIYTTDNGFHIGQHRLQPGKTTCYEEDINIPFMIRGPGIPKGAVMKYPTNHVDLAPTIFDLAGIPLRDDFDGTPMPIKDHKKPQKYESVNIEFWGVPFVQEGKYGTEALTFNDTYKSVRLIGSGYNLMYSVWCTNEHELYDMHADPAQMKNLFGTKSYLFGLPVQKIVSRLNGLVMVLKRCQGQQCVSPWKTLHPKGNVKCLSDALHPKYDSFYEKVMPQVSFEECMPGFIVSKEGPQIPAIYGMTEEESKYSYLNGSDWAMWA